MTKYYQKSRRTHTKETQKPERPPKRSNTIRLCKHIKENGDICNLPLTSYNLTKSCYHHKNIKIYSPKITLKSKNA